MTRGVCLLLLLLSSWLWSAPSLRVHGLPSRAAVVADGSREARAAAASDHIAAQTAMPEVPKAPLLARLPPTTVHAAAPGPIRRWSLLARPGDRREALRRVQSRRRLPRLGGDEPPWC